MTGRASEAALDALHGLLSAILQEELVAARKAAKEQNVPINPQLLDKVMKFLAQNGVDAPASAPRVDALAKELNDLDLDGLALGAPH